MTYLIMKSLHIMAVIAWLAGLFYLPRLFVYHADAEPGSETSPDMFLMGASVIELILNCLLQITN